MSERLTTILKRKLDELSAYTSIDAETRRNALKEELHYYILNFICHHPEYSTWIMYGGSALRIIHGLDRMSVDLDFEVANAITEEFLEKLKTEIEDHFANAYGTNSDFLTIKTTNGRGLLLKFSLGEELSFGHPSNQLHVKIDLNHFVVPKTITERRPINHGQLSFVIVTYSMSALMASKIAAIFLRGTRGVGTDNYEEKGRDVYDLLWYMNKKVTPDLDYLIAKKIEVKDLRALFDKLTIRMNKVSDKNLEQDLLPLFTEGSYIRNWLKNWRESYLRLLEDYEIRTVKELGSISIHRDFRSDNFSFVYWYKTEDGVSSAVTYTISDYWISFREGDLLIEADKKLDNVIEFINNRSSSRPAPQDKLKQYATLFYRKTEDYFKKTNRVMLGDSIDTKVIRMTADNLNFKEQIVLNKSALLSCDLDDLLK
jgi:hypothetical protein